MAAPARTIDDMRKDCADAFQRAQPYHDELKSIYRYFMPFRQPTIQRSPESGGVSEGQSVTDYLFDGTGVSAAANFAGTMQADWMPPHQKFFKLEAGPFLPENTDRIQLNKALAHVTDRVHAVLPRTHVTVHEMMQDLFAGTGAMYLAKGDKRQPVNGVAVPVIEIAMNEGPWGDVWEVFWKRQYKLKHLETMWPDGDFSDTLAKAIKDDRNGDCEVVQYTYWDVIDKRWKLCVWCNKDKSDSKLHGEDFETTPWITPRMFKAPGEAFGRGLAHLALPFVKTANRGRELELKAAAFAILGIWMRRNDGVFNPDNAVFDPGAMWTVAQTGGPYASLARLPVPEGFDISNIVMQDEREQIRKVLLDDELPMEQDAVRSATEVAARLRRYARSRGGTGARIAQELVVPTVERTADLLFQQEMLPSRVTIDQILTKCIITAPAAASQRAGEVEAAVSWLQIMIQLFGPKAAFLTAEVEKMLPEFGRWMGVDERNIREKADAEELKGVLAEIIAAQEKAEAAATAKPPAPQQQYMNGAM